MSVAFGTQHAMRVRHIVICGLTSSTIFLHILPQTAQFSKKKKVTEHKMCVLIFSTTFVWNISHSEKNWARCHECILVFLNYPFFLTDFNEIRISSTRFSKSTLKFIEFRPLGAELLHAGRRTDGRRGLMKLTVAFRNSANALRPVTLIRYDAVRANLRFKMKDAPECNVILILCSIRW